MTKTPPRNNYAAPHTPIASAKRPRSSATSSTKTPTTTKTPTSMKTAVSDNTPMSPMHPPRPVTRDDLETVSEEVTDDSSPSNSSTTSNGSWVGRKVDALFSPVLSFLNGTEDAQPGVQQEHEQNATHTIKEEVAAITEDEDVDMANGNNHMDTEDEEEQQPPPPATPTSTMVVAAAPVVVQHHPQAAVEEEEEEEEEEDEDPYGSLQEEPSSSFEEEEFNPYLFIKSLPPYSHVSHMSPPIALPAKTSNHKLTLVLDLDETLVHCTVEKVHDADLVFPVVFHGAEYQVHVRLRPYLFEFLESVSQKFEVVVFTASQQVYADKLLDRIDPERKYIQHRMFRESCLAVEGNYLKDLHVCGRDLTKTVLVDNSPHAFGYQVDNGIPIESWFDDLQDNELMKLDAFLKTLHGEPDVRKCVRERFQTYKLINQY
eukprot:CAMPEP_0195286060 /NCGR_PEP_ID=MMETSP0707-20130614/3663_1 /TAXON_ID=33640 /ORGANISM="Asterionellopsis glacialis, Strain CCMP134" /LENGTH=429 /DNA_ID=CAMNT_0040345653 /DNA_START=143 /DNA_END=1432 /DNA_ORIENTATION=+